MAPHLSRLRKLFSNTLMGFSTQFEHRTRRVGMTKRRTPKWSQPARSTLNAAELREVDIRRLLGLFHISQVRADLIGRYIAGEIDPDVPIMSYRQAGEDVDRRFEAMVRSQSIASFHIHIIGEDLSAIGRQITAWSISRDDWKLWRGTSMCRNLIKEYTGSGLNPMEAEVRAILFYLEFNEKTPVREPVHLKHKRRQPGPQNALHRHNHSLREWWRWRRDQDEGLDRPDTRILEEARRLDNAMIPNE